MMTPAMDCASFDERLADYLEGDLAPADRRRLEAHLASCVRCTALVRDLEQIRASASSLPELAPSRDLWEDIASRIEAPVVPFAARSAPNAARRFDRWRNAAIAAALVAVTAGVTYTLTVARGTARPGTSASVAASTPTTPASPVASAPANGDTTARRTIPAAQDLAAAPGASPSGTPTDDRSPSRAARQQVSNATPEVTYSREIDHLRSIFTRNRAQLDPRTAAIIEANLKVIDDAIAQSKAALAQDPASRFLNDQLNTALGKKLELLRTAAFLPNRT